MKESKGYTFEEILEERGCFAYTNVGCSMMPLLRERRDVIVIRKKDPRRCRKYDVVLYKRAEKYILHRVLRVLPSGYVVAGDHNNFLDPLVTDDMILGVMTAVKRDGREIGVDDLRYRLYVHLWCDSYPLRMLLFRGKAFVYYRLRRLLQIVKHHEA